MLCLVAVHKPGVAGGGWDDDENDDGDVMSGNLPQGDLVSYWSSGSMSARLRHIIYFSHFITD